MASPKQVTARLDIIQSYLYICLIWKTDQKWNQKQYVHNYKQNTETLNQSQFSNGWNFSHNELARKKRKKYV